MKSLKIHHGLRCIGITLAATQLISCAEVHVNNSRLAQSETAELAIDGFNYTDLPIDLFSVDSNGGGNILVSTPTSGGSGSICCYKLFIKASQPQKVEVKWMRTIASRQRWCKKIVDMAAPLPSSPRHMGVHFMPDGNIQIEVTDGYPQMKLRLERFDPVHRKSGDNVIYDEQMATCSDDQ